MKLRIAKNDLGAAFSAALPSLSPAVASGLIATSPLGAEWAVLGITASVGSAILFGIVSGALSTNRYLVSGPRAMSALVLAAGIQTMLDRGYGAPEAVALAFVGVVLSGAFQGIAGLSGLGRFVAYVPAPVLAGFVNASVVLVVVSSLPMVLGLPAMRMPEILAGGIAGASLWAMAVGGTAMLCTFALNGRIRFLPSALVGLVAGAAVYHLGVVYFDRPPGPVVGHIDLVALVRMPMLLATELGWSTIWEEIDIALLTGVSIGLLSAFDTVLSGSALDRHTGIDGDANRDLRLHGLANIAMGVLGFLPGAGALGRSVAIFDSGAETRAANMGIGVFFFLVLALLAPVVAILPLWATAGMLVASAVQVIDKPTVGKVRDILSRALPYPRILAGDVLVTLAVVVVALASNLIAAVGAGVVLAALLFVLGMGRDPVRRTYFGAKVHSKVQRPAEQTRILDRDGVRIAVIEVQGALFFGACARLQAEARDLLSHDVTYLILDFRHLTSIDSTGSMLLRGLAGTCAEAGARLLLSCVEPERRVDPAGRREHARTHPEVVAVDHGALRWVWLNLQANGVVPAIGPDRIFDDTDAALAACEEDLLERLAGSGKHGTRGIIDGSAIFAGLTRGQILAIGRHAQRHHFHAGDTVFFQGSPGDRAFFLAAGRMDVLIDIPGSVRKRRVSSLAEGTLFAEMAMLDGGLRSATIRAVAPSVCYSIDREGFDRLQQELPDVALILMRNISRQFADRLRRANNIISELEQ